jgi:hypothetical protein
MPGQGTAGEGKAALLLTKYLCYNVRQLKSTDEHWSVAITVYDVVYIKRPDSNITLSYHIYVVGSKQRFHYILSTWQGVSEASVIAHGLHLGQSSPIPIYARDPLSS